MIAQDKNFKKTAVDLSIGCLCIRFLKLFSPICIKSIYHLSRMRQVDSRHCQKSQVKLFAEIVN